MIRGDRWTAEGAVRDAFRKLGWPRAYRFDWPRANFLTFFLLEPRGVVRFAFGAAFLRAARFTFFRSARSSILVVSATVSSFATFASARFCPVNMPFYGISP